MKAGKGGLVIGRLGRWPAGKGGSGKRGQRKKRKLGEGTGQGWETLGAGLGRRAHVVRRLECMTGPVSAWSSSPSVLPLRHELWLGY